MPFLYLPNTAFNFYRLSFVNTKKKVKKDKIQQK